jgi:hypothetical protein
MFNLFLWSSLCKLIDILGGCTAWIIQMFVMSFLSLTKFLVTQKLGTSGKLCARYGQ